ncbi:MAG: hypothetical protein HC796_09905 [Synechococcaceae cyanobacterium RL_1_2]|nr:hypothetical protein [Synechococcaceae cyanobacterium RL_1_2]
MVVQQEPPLTDDLVPEAEAQAPAPIKDEQPELEVVAIEPSAVTAVPRLKLKGDKVAEPKPTLSIEEEEVMDTQANALTIKEMIGEDVDDDDDDDYDEEDDGDDGDDGEDEDEDNPVEIMPLAEAVWPRVVYLIVDRNGELMTRTLQEFRYLGPVPATEANEVALPIFDNHRVAKRYTNKREKVIKIPDCGLFQKTTPNLRSKGISRILMKSHIYTLT